MLEALSGGMILPLPSLTPQEEERSLSASMSATKNGELTGKGILQNLSSLFPACWF